MAGPPPPWLQWQVAEQRNEALIRLGIEQLQQHQPRLALLPLASACAKLLGMANLRALLGQCLEKIASPEQLDRYLQAALRDFPAEPALRQQYWYNSQRLCNPGELQQRVLAQLADIDQPGELGLVLRLLAASPDTCQPVGVVHHDPQSNQLHGWAIDLAQPGQIPAIHLQAGPQGGEFLADQPCPLLAAAGFTGRQGGLLIQLPQPLARLDISFSDSKIPLVGSPLATLPLFEPPATSPLDPAHQPVDILVPIYGGRQATLDCLDSLLRSSRQNRIPHRIIVLDDASPDAALVQAIRTLAEQGRLEYRRWPANLGFIRSMNRGMALHPERDVVWLNADTLVHGDWLDRLRAAAWKANDIASVTPFTNNGELMSFPEIRGCTPMPNPDELARLDRAARRYTGSAVEIVMGCGFCLYLRRHALNAVGYLDEQTLRRGYGEESDWCLRASQRGWRHLGATNVFVAHAGGHSFGAEKALRAYQNNQVIRQRYPDAERQFYSFVAHDPLISARKALQQQLAIHPPRPAKNKKAPAKIPALTRKYPKLPGQSWLIADSLDDVITGTAWLQLARQLRRKNSPLQLLVDQSGPWQNQLAQCRNIWPIPRVAGLDRAELLELAGTVLAISLDERNQPAAHQQIRQRASDARLPLFAPASSWLCQQGAFSLDTLSPYLPE